MESAGSAGGIGDILRNIGVAITAVVFLFAGLTLVTASVIIPGKERSTLLYICRNGSKMCRFDIFL